MKAISYHTRWALGHDRYLDFTDCEGNIVGAIETHPSAKTGEPCQGHIWFDVPELTEAIYIPGSPKWTVESWQPLTLSPSILCRGCGNHGFIKDGVWIPA